MLITVRSKPKQDNVGFRPGAGGPVPVNARSGSLAFYAPFLELPPYMANVSSISASGERSRVTSTVAPEPGPYCLQTRPLAECERAARAKFTRCQQGRATRSAPRLGCRCAGSPRTRRSCARRAIRACSTPSAHRTGRRTTPPAASARRALITAQDRPDSAHPKVCGVHTLTMPRSLQLGQPSRSQLNE
jgi:hypothetical protein